LHAGSFIYPEDPEVHLATGEPSGPFPYQLFPTADAWLFLACGIPVLLSDTPGWNPGKRSLPVDLKQPAGREIIERLLPSIDVFVENFREGVMERLGFGYTRLQHQYPRLIYCAVTAYGSTGPYAHKPGFDPLAQALSGIMARHGGS
jgi:crotonobetainyl-CoA:carnitine CoA-transferase CaiB-like acyl-CoA transferase